MNIDRIQKQIDAVMASPVSQDEKSRLILGRKGIIATALRTVKELPDSGRAAAGAALNVLKHRLVETLQKAETAETPFDLSLPPRSTETGSFHPILATIDRVVEIFASLGFVVQTGNEIVSDYDNFGSLHFPLNHPVRDTQKSFMVADLPDLLLRTQTSAAQVPIMSLNDLPLRVLVPGKTFRSEIDATHQPTFHQIEGFIVDEQVTFADLKGMLEYFIEELFGRPMRTRFRPHFFPFTEPSAEVDVYWERPDGTSRWLEIAGSGCIHPAVLQNAGINPKKYQGVAFGFGADRLTMLLHGITQMRALSNNDEELLRQFAPL